jgi:hypothetical protein
MMTHTEAENVAIWARSHDWCMAAFVDGAETGEGYVVAVRVRASEARDEYRGGHVMPDAGVHEDTASFATFASMRDWAGY